MTSESLDDIMADAVAKTNSNKAITLQDKYKARLEAYGFKRDLSTRTSKYIVMTHLKYPYKVYLGRNGAIRVGYTLASSTSWTHAARGFLANIEIHLSTN